MEATLSGKQKRTLILLFSVVGAIEAVLWLIAIA